MLPPQTLPRQYLVSLESHSVPQAWRQLSIKSLCISTAHDLPITRVLIDGTEKAWILGWFSDSARWFCADTVLRVQGLEAWGRKKTALAGRFVLIENETDRVSVRTDAGGLLPAVFDRDTGVIGASPAALSHFRDLERDTQVSCGVLRQDRAIWYPFGTVPYKGMIRLLPSQALDLRTGCFQRDSLRGGDAVKGSNVVAAIRSEVVAHVRAVGAREQVGVHLTAGRDSRMVFAAAIAAGIDFEAETIAAPGAGASLDLYTAKRLARGSGVRHREIPFVPASTSDTRAWAERTGFCVKDAVTHLCRTVSQYDLARFSLTGTGGEVGRAFYWDKGDLGECSLTGGELLARMGFQRTRYLEHEAEQWLDQFETKTGTTEILDRAYIDNRLCCWAGPSVVGHLTTRPTVSPFNSRWIYTEMMRAPEESRWNQEFASEFVKGVSPNLMLIPFNRAKGLSKVRFIKHELKAALPSSVKRRLKQWIMWGARRGGNGSSDTGGNR